MRKIILIVFILFANVFVYSQEEKDTIFLSEFEVTSKPKFEDQMSKGHYGWLEKKVKNAYPIFSMMHKDYLEFNLSLDSLKTKRQKKAFINQKHKEFDLKYRKILMNLTQTEGRILCKMIHRYTEKTPFQIIKELKGPVFANFINMQTFVVSINLNEPYEPDERREDSYIEIILKRSFSDGTLIDVDKNLE